MAHKFDPAHAQKLDNGERQRIQPVEEILGRIPLEPSMKVADLGCGTGYFALPLAKAVGPQGKVYAVDVSEKLLGMLQEKISLHGPANIELIKAEAESTGILTGSLDLVFMANVWHEFEDHVRLMKEVGRILKKAGLLVILDWRPDVVTPPGPPADERIPSGTVVEEVQKAGFRVTDQVNTGRFHYFVRAVYS